MRDLDQKIVSKN